MTDFAPRPFSSAAARPDRELLDTVNALLGSAMGRRDWPLSMYTHARLFSMEARRKWIEPDKSSI